jgi:hypothetical protein
MPEVLAQFAEPVISDGDRTRYRAQACGAATSSGMWEGWIEFLPIAGGELVRTARETTQPNRTDAEYWASGLSTTYLEGALERALRGPIVRTIAPPARPRFTSPAVDVSAVEAPAIHGRAILDPFSVYEKGEGLLRQELGALSDWHLVNIILAYGLSELSPATLNQLPQRALIDVIVTGARAHALAQ